MYFEIVGSIQNVEIFAIGSSIRNLPRSPAGSCDSSTTGGGVRREQGDEAHEGRLAAE